MGYTHYWEIKTVSQHSARWEACHSDITRIIKESPVPLGDAHGQGEPAIHESQVLLNGSAEADRCHETFHFPGGPGFNFCKTAYKPYDVVVTACLSVAKDIFGDEIGVSSDGNAFDWEAGVALANRVLGRTIANPIMDRG